MAINLNIDKYGAQFSAFVNFANEMDLLYPGFNLIKKALDIRKPL